MRLLSARVTRRLMGREWRVEPAIDPRGALAKPIAALLSGAGSGARSRPSHEQGGGVGSQMGGYPVCRRSVASACRTLGTALLCPPIFALALLLFSAPAHAAVVAVACTLPTLEDHGIECRPDTLKVPLYDLETVELWGRLCCDAAMRLLASESVRGREGERIILSWEAGGEMWWVWVRTLDRSGNPSCWSDSVTMIDPTWPWGAALRSLTMRKVAEEVAVSRAIGAGRVLPRGGLLPR